MMTYRAKFWLFGGLSLAAVIVVGVLTRQILPIGGGSEQPHFAFPLLLALSAPVFATNWLWWKRTDDLQQQGQLVSWYWGSTFGGFVLLVYVVTFFGWENGITRGAFYMLVAQIVGFTLLWLVWLLRGRGQSE